MTGPFAAAAHGHRRGMIAPVVILVLVAVVAVLALLWLLRGSKERGATAEALESAETETLEYPVPPGQDPVVELTALESEGFATSLDATGEVVLIHCPSGREVARPLARAAISRADSTAVEHGAPMSDNAVRFRDERNWQRGQHMDVDQIVDFALDPRG